MAIQQSFYPLDGRTKTYPQSKHVPTKQHARCLVREILTTNYIVVGVDDYDLINNAIVFKEAVSATLYNQLEIRVADTQDELGESPSDISIVASIADEVVIVAGIEDEVVQVATDSANVNLVGDDLALGLGTNQPTDSSILNALTNADIAIANAALTAADVVSTGEDLALTNADVVTAEASKEFANDWAVSPTLVDDGVNPLDKSARTYALEAAAYSPTTNLSQVAVSKQTAGTIGVSNVVSIVSDSDPFLDASQVFKYELDGDTLDTDQVTPVDGTPTGITYDYEGQKFGSAQAVFDGATSKILGTASIASNAFTYSMVVTPDTVDSELKYLIDFSTGRGIFSNGTNATIVTSNLAYYDNATWHDLGYSLTIGKQETVCITVNGTSLNLYIDGLLISSHTVASTSIDGNFGVGSVNTGSAQFFTGKIDQVEVYNRALTATEMEALYFQEITRTDNLITTTDVEVSYHDGYNLGAVNTAEALTNPTIEALTPSAINFGYVNEGSNTISWTVDEPVYGKNNKRTVAGYNPDIIDEGFTYSSSNGGEKVVNGTNLIDTTGWTAGELNDSTPSILSVVNGRLRITNNGATYGTASQAIAVEIGKKYTFKEDCLLGTAVADRTRVGNSANTDEYGLFVETNSGTRELTVVPTQTPIYVTLANSAESGAYNDFEIITLFETNIEKDTAYVTPRTYLNTKIEADSAGKPAVASEWIGGSLVERRGVFEKAEINNLVVQDGFDLGQVYEDITSIITEGVEEINNTGKPIILNAWTVSTASTTRRLQILVDGEIVAYTWIGVSVSTALSYVTAIVPVGSTYEFSLLNNVDTILSYN